MVGVGFLSRGILKLGDGFWMNLGPIGLEVVKSSGMISLFEYQY